MTFEAWLDAFFDAYYRQRPVNATFIGVHTYDDQLPDLSVEGRDRVRGEAGDLLSRLDGACLDSPTPGQMDRVLAEGFLRVQQWEATRLDPCQVTGEAIFGVISLLLRPFAPLPQRLDGARSRLAKIPAFVDTAMAQLTSAPEAWIERARHECAGAQLLLTDVAAEYPILAGVTEGAAAAFDRFDAHLAHDVRSTEDYACGAEAFDLLLRHAHFAETDADGVERLALERIAEEEAFLHSASPPNSDPPANGADYLERFQTLWQTVRDLTETYDVLTFPSDFPVHFVERPVWARRAAPYLYFLPYRAPAPFDHSPDLDYLAPPGADDSTIKLNHVVHHAGLGHHVQNWFAMRSPSRIGQIAAVDCASRIAMLCGGTMAEGWANYATDLAEDCFPEFLSPSERYGQHRARLRMAARAVVDIRLHQGRFSLSEAIAFYTDRVGMSASGARAEAVKNSLFPAAACMYLIGWDGLWRLRREMQARQGASFALRGFHDQVLSFGSVPVSLIARAMLASASVPALPRS